MVGTGTYDANLEPTPRVPASKSVAHIDLVARIEVVDCPLTVEEKCVLINRVIDRPPPHILLRIRMTHYMLVIWTTASFCARTNRDCSARNNSCPLASDCIFVEAGRGGIAHYNGTIDLMRRQIDVHHHRNLSEDCVDHSGTIGRASDKHPKRQPQ